ncbi:MAG: sigma-70 family RNA polymerase sigma factor [Muribaculaceae bacterium]|nr:sigma-70 family RNA polymerase sigma factor [Muribaculaceae bacterium]
MQTLSYTIFPPRSIFWQFMLLMSRDNHTDATAVDKDFFMTVDSRYNTIVDKICFTFASDLNDFDDLRQDAWLNIWRGIDSFRGESKPSTWIYRIAINSCVSTARTTKKHRGILGIDEAERCVADTPDNDSVERLHYLLSCLNPIDRSIMLLRLEELDYEEIAGIMGMPRNTIATRLRRIRIKLAQLNNRKDI